MPATQTILVARPPCFHVRGEYLSEFRGVLIELPSGFDWADVARLSVRANGVRVLHESSGLDLVRHHRMEGVRIPRGHVGVILRPGQYFPRGVDTVYFSLDLMPGRNWQYGDGDYLRVWGIV